MTTMLWFNSRAEIDGTLTAVVSDELLNAVSSNVAENSILRGGSNAEGVIKEIRDIANRDVTCSITDFKSGRYYYHKHTEYGVQIPPETSNIRIYKLPGQTIRLINLGLGGTTVTIIGKTAGIDIIETIYTVSLLPAETKIA